jgi:ABC-type sugar transport system permease subunit
MMAGAPASYSGELTVTDALVADETGPTASVGTRRPRRRPRPGLGPLPWIGPALLLIFGVVLWPAIEMVRTSLLRISISGVTKGFAGIDNFRKLFANPELAGVLTRTLVWVVIVVIVTIVISLGLAQLLNARYPGRRLVRWALIVPWAVSVVMTATIWRWILDGFYGVMNRILSDLHLIASPVAWLGDSSVAFVWLMAVAVFVSLPFTTYVILAGLQSIPGDVFEAAKVDGAGPWRTFRDISLPLLRPALLVATLINMINVFNSFPIIWVMTKGGPGYQTDTTTTFMYKIAFRSQDIGQSAAMAVVNFAIILIIVGLYLRTVSWRERA